MECAIFTLPQERRDALGKKLEGLVCNINLFLGHAIRRKHQSDYYEHVIDNLKDGEAVVVLDYKMKIETGIKSREIQREWYGKRGISLHGCLVHRSGVTAI